MKTHISRLVAMAALAVLPLTLVGCGEDAAPAQLRVVHDSPDAPAVDIYAEGVDAPLLANLAYGQTSAYLSVAPGSYNLQIRAAGAPATSAPVFSTGALELAADAKITAVAAGLLASTAPSDRFRVLVLPEGFNAPAAGKARVRIVHASPDAPSVALDVGDDGGAPEITSLARFGDTGVTGIDLPAGVSLQLGVYAGGARVTAFTIPALPAGAELFVVASGLLVKPARVANGFSLLAVSPAGTLATIKQNPIVYALHGSPDAPAVDIFYGQAQLADNLAFGELSGKIQVPTGAYALDFFAYSPGSTRPAGSPVVTKTTPNLEAGERYLAVASGFLAPGAGTTPVEQPFSLQAFREGFDAVAATALVRTIHSSPNVGAVDVGTAAGSALTPIQPLSGLSFGQASIDAGVAPPAGDLTIGIGGMGSDTALAKYGLVTTASSRVFAIAIGALPATVGRRALTLQYIATSTDPWTIAPAPIR